MEAESGTTLLFIPKGSIMPSGVCSESSLFAPLVIPELKLFQCDYQSDIYWKVEL